MPKDDLIVTCLSDSDKARFAQKVIEGDVKSCWNWTAGKSKAGYGHFWLRGKSFGAHRIAMMLHTGILDQSMLVCHTCDNPSCCNPSHLFYGTPLDNMLDKVSKGRIQRGDGHYSRTNPEYLSRGDNHYARLHPEKVARGDAHGSRLHPERVARGERSGMAKLNWEKVRAIRSDPRPHIALAKEYGVSKSLISAVRNFKVWATDISVS